jgi:tetratricopeptide (TPR) repeat protein
MSAARLTKSQLSAVLCLALAVVTLAVYWPMSRHDFINLDDEQYITANPHVTSGLTLTNVVWAFTTSEAANWHPLTWISHMMDCTLYGENPAGHHLTNLLFHIANTLLLFLLLKEITGALWRSFFVAALFAWHPLHVESVAWAAERKDVLSTFFWMLALLAYARYAQKRLKTAVPALDSRLSTLDYLLALFFFACGLMSKPMVVTLPFVLLLLDFWPLNRVSGFRFQVSGSEPAKPSTCNFQPATFARLIFEKLPFFALALAGSVATYLVQKSAGATWSAGALPFSARVANALVSYARYISKTFWPTDLAVIYPYPHHWPVEFATGAALLLAIWSALFILRWKQNPYLLTGWLWFLGTLVPVIGLVQVGSQSIADRYTYIPSIGLFIIAVWGANDLLGRWPEWKKFLPVAGGVALTGCLAVTSIQLNYWRDSISLFSHAVEVTADNYTACNFLGRALDDIGQKDEALFCYAESVEIEPRYPQAQFNLGMALWRKNRLDEASEHLAAAARLVPDNAAARYYLARTLWLRHKPGEAVFQYREALRLTPDFPEAIKELDEILAAHPELR